MVNRDSGLYPPSVSGTVVQVDENPDDENYVEMGAVFSESRNYRYYLWRVWDPSLPTLAWVMCNPSTADDEGDDPTMNLVRNHSKRAGYGSCFVANLFAWVTPYSDELLEVDDPVGGHNNLFLKHIAEHSDVVLGAWGSVGDKYGRPEEVREILDSKIHALKTTKHGQPQHPQGISTEARPAPLGSFE